MSQTPGSPDDDISGAFSSLFGKIMDNLKDSVLPGGDAGTDAFFQALVLNQADKVGSMLAAGIDPNLYSKTGETPLHVAARKNRVEITALLLDAGADPRRGTQRQPHDYPPIEDAVRFGAVEVAELLARRGGYSEQDKAGGLSLLHRACEKGKDQIVRALIRAGADANAVSENGATPLLSALMSNKTAVALALLDFPQVAAEMNTRCVDTDAQARTAFQLAVARGETAVVERMIALGSFVNRPDAEGVTPLMQAIARGDADMVRVLARGGADVNATGAQGPALLCAMSCKTLSVPQRGEIAQVLIDAGADTAAKDPVSGMTALHAALASHRWAEALKVLLRAGAEIEARDASGATPLFTAILEATAQEVDALIRAGADIGARHGADAATPLIAAARAGQAESVGKLLAAGADAALLDASGASALSYARARKDGSGLVEKIEDALRRDSKPMFRGPSRGQS